MYTIKQASLRTGVGIPLLRAWERRYGIPKPERTASGYRLYGEEAIGQLRAMRRLVDEGWTPSQAAVEVREGRGPQAPTATDTGGPAPAAATFSTAASLIERIVRAAEALDEAAMEAALGEATVASDFETAVEQVWLPAMVAVGEAWASGELDVASEHALSAVVLRRLGVAYEAAARGASRPQVLVGLPPGSRHELGALAFAVAGRRSGLDLLYLGPDVPVESWSRAVEESGAMAVVLGVTGESDRRGAREVISAVASGHAAPQVFVGGRGAAGADLSPARTLPVTLRTAVDTVREALR